MLCIKHTPHLIPTHLFEIKQIFFFSNPATKRIVGPRSHIEHQFQFGFFTPVRSSCIIHQQKTITIIKHLGKLMEKEQFSGVKREKHKFKNRLFLYIELDQDSLNMSINLTSCIQIIYFVSLFIREMTDTFQIISISKGNKYIFTNITSSACLSWWTL